MCSVHSPYQKDMYTLEAGVIRSHAVELQARNSLHALFGHILLGEDNGQFLWHGRYGS